MDTFYDLHFAKHLTDVQTDVHIVPVDSEAQNCNLLILPTTGGALVLYIGLYLSASTINPITSCANTLICRHCAMSARCGDVQIYCYCDSYYLNCKFKY